MALTAPDENLIISKATRISSIESSLRSLTWFLPGRFQDSELASEALYTVLNILGAYHDSVLLRTVSGLPSPVRPPSSLHARYTRHYVQTSSTYHLLARLLCLLSYSELLLEMGIRKRVGRKQAEQAVIAIEATKAALRLGLMRTTQGRSAVNPPIAEREIDPSVLDLHRPHLVRSSSNPRISFEATKDHPRSAADVLLGKNGQDGTNPEQDEDPEKPLDYWTGPRTGVTRSTIAHLRGGVDEDDPLPGTSIAKGKDAVKDYLMTRVLTVEDVKKPEDLVGKTKGLGRLAEVIWILRPLIYVLAMRKYGQRHTLPYLLSLALEYLAFSLRKSSTRQQAGTKASGPMLPHAPSELEKAETKKRANAFWWYLLRGPVWETWTKPRLLAFADKFEAKPLIGFVSTVVHDYTPLVDDYYFCESLRDFIEM
ncbi:BQ5605_C021g09334 [Microbotryum silenes-dioicae]|uniref:Peroxisomal membrane protein PEX16 n=1 Tax=Microbotryum silenes-dioicae TaxID=796604 RepID=A0A2X0ND26_9BASI|nr:BQ5605_C021g09334 [Microbotryum silenes-dioicae]